MNITSISLATQILCVIVITIFVSSRYVIKQRLRLFFGVEDGGYTALYSGNMLRDPLSTVLHRLVLTIGKVFYVAAFFYVPMILFVKLALLFMLIRVFQPHNNHFTYIHVFIILIIFYYIAIFFAKIFICNPIRAYWESEDNKATCLNKSAVIVADSIIRCIAVAFSLYRLVLLCLGFDNPQDMSLILRILLTDNAEGGLGLICACLPALNKLIHTLM
ncbi:predicted protein [Aspergillus terreus NIH2624]|uniref:Rhodopsin domain-containing protein n=1 Tax=Aspergillus terreus (strain NIH 2624 / FGSC A1156) TaxID=341663 RepID=Q0CFG4_ASPTN|nr:uncharacterized protein ATEG_07570 [Aspergillus terreus NIH2624]EAU31832.1 predicted protein [Aspergillus terreus NIH2624]